jgi:hypothetical protein
MITKSLALVALVGAMTAYSTSKAEATLVAYICDDASCTAGVGPGTGNNDYSAQDNMAGDTNGSANVINFTAPVTIGSYEVLINIAQRIGGGLDLNYTVTNNAGGGAAGTVWLWAVDTDFPGPAVIHGVAGGTDGGGSVTGWICGADDNTQAKPNDGPCDSAADGAAGLATLIAVNHAATGNPYAYAIGIQVSGVPNNKTATGDFSASVPEPVSLSLLGLGLAGYAVRRRRQA